MEQAIERDGYYRISARTKDPAWQLAFLDHNGDYLAFTRSARTAQHIQHFWAVIHLKAGQTVSPLINSRKRTGILDFTVEAAPGYGAAVLA